LTLRSWAGEKHGAPFKAAARDMQERFSIFGIILRRQSKEVPCSSTFDDRTRNRTRPAAWLSAV